MLEDTNEAWHVCMWCANLMQSPRFSRFYCLPFLDLGRKAVGLAVRLAVRRCVFLCGAFRGRLVTWREQLVGDERASC